MTPDLARLAAIGREAEALYDAGTLTKARFKRLLEEARAAADGAVDLTEFLFVFARPGWIPAAR